MRRRRALSLALILLAAVPGCSDEPPQAPSTEAGSGTAVKVEADVNVDSSKIRPDERIILFPTAARISDDGEEWIVPVHGWIFEPEENSAKRRLAVATLEELFALEAQPPQKQRRFKQRISRFLVDNERRKRIAVRIGNHVEVLPKSEEDGHFEGEVRLSLDEVRRLQQQSKLTITAVTHNDDGREFTGEAVLIGPYGLSVISDIDDTIKVTEVTDHKAMLRRTFLEPFEPAPGMAELYRGWAEAAADKDKPSSVTAVAFHYVSSSPWQLYEPLSELTAAAGFPPATFHLKRFRLGPSGVKALLADPLKTKPKVIRQIIEAYPLRRFVLVGDSGEKDPEVYGQIAQDYPQQVERILIRAVTDEPPDAPRYRRAFEGVPAAKWQVFRDPAEIKALER